jgi:hypothetical protein
MNGLVSDDPKVSATCRTNRPENQLNTCDIHISSIAKELGTHPEVPARKEIGREEQNEKNLLNVTTYNIKGIRLLPLKRNLAELNSPSIAY